MAARVAPSAAEPIGRGEAAMRSRMAMARPEENCVAGLSAGAGAGAPSGLMPTTTSAATRATTSPESTYFLAVTSSA